MIADLVWRKVKGVELRCDDIEPTLPLLSTMEDFFEKALDLSICSLAVSDLDKQLPVNGIIATRAMEGIAIRAFT